MHEQPTIEDRLWDYIDGTCGEAEKGIVHELIATRQEWRDKYHALLDAHRLLQQSIELDEPSLRFTRNVMDEIARYNIAPATRTYIDKKVIRGIALFFGVMITGFLLYGFAQINWSAADGVTGSWWDKISSPKIRWGLFFNNTYVNVFMMVNVVLGLMLLDMYLERKKKQARG